jgi:outer membrane protein assembly factor BamB
VWGLGAEGDGHLHGFDGDTGAQIFSGAATTITGLHRFNSPIAAKGRIFVGADSGVVAFTP